MKRKYLFLILGLLVITSCSNSTGGDEAPPIDELNLDDLENWKTTVFGQSTSGYNNNHVKNLDGEDIRTGFYPEFQIESRGGKYIGHDGIGFYYKEVSTDRNFVLEADMKIVQFGPLAPNQTENRQEGLGLMVRDIIGEHGVSSYLAASNLVATRISEKKLNLYGRDGTLARVGNPNIIVENTKIADVVYGETHKIKLERTDRNFIVSYTSADGKTSTQVKADLRTRCCTKN